MIIGTIVINIFIYLRIYIYQKKGSEDFSTKIISLKNLSIMDGEGKNMANYYLTNLFTIMTFVSTAIIISKLNHVNPADFGKYPYNVWLYYRQLLSPGLGIFLISFTFLVRKNYIKLYMDELKSLLTDYKK